MSELFWTCVAAAGTLAFLALVFVPLERLFPRRAQPFLRREWALDLTFFLGQQLVWRGLALAALGALAVALDSQVPSAFRDAVAAQPLALQIVEVVLLCDVVVYWGHRLSHKVPLLWRFHRVHHTSTHLDWLAAYREHPVDGLYTMALENLPAVLLGFPLELIAGFVAFRGVWAVFIHSNVRLPLGPLGVLLGSPDLHHWHHDAGPGGHRNFANLSPLMDVIFGTYHHPRPGREPTLGTHEPTPSGYLGQLARPLVDTALIPAGALRAAATHVLRNRRSIRHDRDIALSAAVGRCGGPEESAGEPQTTRPWSSSAERSSRIHRAQRQLADARRAINV